MESKKYYIGLDCGTSSVGWAVTDENYNLLRKKGQTLWGVRLFDEASTAAERRFARSSRRRTRRSRDRIKLLELLFSEEMAKVDPEFYLRLKKSFLWEEDKHLKKNSKNTLFNDPDYQDKDFHKDYQTIWHLRKAIIEDDREKYRDLRHYYLAIHHILRNRGHFLRSDEKIEGAGDFGEIFKEFTEACEAFGFGIKVDCEKELEKLVTNRQMSKIDKRRRVKEILFVEDADLNKCYSELAGLLIGSKVTPLMIFESDLSADEKKDAAKLTFADSNIEEKLAEIESGLDSDQFTLVMTAKKIYDYGYLSELLAGEKLLSNAMVKNYELHQEQLQELKKILKPYEEDYDTFFKTVKVANDKTVCYSAYIGKAYTEDKNGRRKTFRVDQETINKEIVRLLEKYAPNSKLLPDAREGLLLPKQKGQAKGTIPQQLHHAELEIILDKLERDCPSFADKTDEPEDYNTTSKKILSIHSFRIPYYCGPLKKDSEWSWADEEISELVRPWNFKQLVKTDVLADKFIKRMTNKCTYLPGEDVLPKASLLYQKYMVLNELNNLKIDGRRIAQEVKVKIYEQVFLRGELSGNITIKSLGTWLRNNGILEKDSELSGSAETKFLPKLSTHQDFKKILGEDYEKKFKAANLEYAVNLITILNNEPQMLRTKLTELFGEKCTEAQIRALVKRGYKDWAKFSEKFLTGIKIERDGQKVSLLDMLEDGTENLMELLGSKYHFTDEIEKYNVSERPETAEVTYEDIENLYCSPAVKRSIWQAIKIVDELVMVNGCAPDTFFLEATRDGADPNKKGATLSRHKQLLDTYQKIKNSDDAKKLLEELKSKEPRDLQAKKLYLYFTQMGRCAYSGQRIDLESLMTDAYDIDHIYPRSKTKDDSITQNLVLVCAQYNRTKTDSYPISDEWRNKMAGTWRFWRQAGLITKEKYDRLMRATPLSAEELSKFVARQIVETAQSVKALRGLLRQKYPESKIVLVKARQVSDMRQYFANGYRDKETGTVIVPGRPEFVKLRALNDLHHAKDAYLNIIVGNVMSKTFTDNPYKWMSQRPENLINYSINSRNIWRAKPPKNGTFIKGWNYADSIEIISKNMARNNILWTRMVQYKAKTGAISALNLVGRTRKKGEENEGLIQRKKGLDVRKYGGYNKISGAYFMLVELKNKNGEDTRQVVQVPIYAKDAPEHYLSLQPELKNATIIVPLIPIDSLFNIDGALMRISGKTGSSLIFAPALQMFISAKTTAYLKKACEVNNKLRMDKKYKVDLEKDGVSNTLNLEAYNSIINKLNLFKAMLGLGHRVEQLLNATERFVSLSVEEQCKVLENIVIAFGCNTTVSDLSLIIPKAGNVGKCLVNSTLANTKSIELIYQSPTGLFERRINLKTCPPQKPKNARKK